MGGGTVGMEPQATAAKGEVAGATELRVVEFRGIEVRAIEVRATSAEAVAAGDAEASAIASAIAARSKPAALRWLAAGWAYLRAVSGDDAYERYLAHHEAEHAGLAPMSRKAYFAERQTRKWTGVTRCC
jgi:uncharacterized short protein YbdD (DUF466 family)